MDFHQAYDAKQALKPGIDAESGHVFVQWKGTEVCMDFTCACGRDGHVCGEMFAYYVECPCGRLWMMPESLQLVELVGELKAHTKHNVSGCIKTPQEDDP